MNDLKRMKPCAVCGELFPARGRAKYCSPLCRRVGARRRRGHTMHAVTCTFCGKEFASSRKNAKFCGDHGNTEVKAYYNGVQNPVGDPMACAVCGDTITREAPNQLWCKTWCSGKIRCTCCGEVKDSREYYDYRPHGKRLSRCKECERTKALERAERSRG